MFMFDIPANSVRLALLFFIVNIRKQPQEEKVTSSGSNGGGLSERGQCWGMLVLWTSGERGKSQNWGAMKGEGIPVMSNALWLTEIEKISGREGQSGL